MVNFPFSNKKKKKRINLPIFYAANVLCPECKSAYVIEIKEHRPQSLEKSSFGIVLPTLPAPLPTIVVNNTAKTEVEAALVTSRASIEPSESHSSIGKLCVARFCYSGVRFFAFARIVAL